MSERVADVRTIWPFHEKLTKAGAIKTPFGHFDATLKAAGYIAMSGQIVDDRDARWTVKFTKARLREDDSSPPVDLAIPVFGYQNHAYRGFGFIRKWSTTDAAVWAANCARGCSTRQQRAAFGRIPHTGRRPTKSS